VHAVRAVRAEHDGLLDIAVVPQSRIVAHLEDAYTLMRSERG
jgi:hypothetical protein